ncbi:MAG: ferrous iron transport protein A [Campylobacteraceae bacterium]|mgnify:CR=1 FL=1|nr:ferrous iron transport protein A [Campylobacteraceae bacterium]
MKISELKAGDTAKITNIANKGELKKRLADMGVVTGAIVEYKRSAPLGDPIQFIVKQSGIAIRKCDAEHIDVEIVSKK